MWSSYCLSRRSHTRSRSLNSRVMFSTALVSIVLATAGCSKAQENADVPETSATPSVSTQSAAPSSAMSSSTIAASSQPTADAESAVQWYVNSFEERAKNGVASRITFIREIVNGYGNDVTEAQAREIVDMADIDWNEEATEYAVDSMKSTGRSNPNATVLDAKNMSEGFMLDMGFTQEEIDYGFEKGVQRLKLEKNIEEAFSQQNTN